MKRFKALLPVSSFIIFHSPPPPLFSGPQEGEEEATLCREPEKVKGTFSSLSARAAAMKGAQKGREQAGLWSLLLTAYICCRNTAYSECYWNTAYIAETKHRDGLQPTTNKQRKADL